MAKKTTKTTKKAEAVETKKSTKKTKEPAEEKNERGFGKFGRGYKALANCLVKMTKKNPDGFTVSLDTVREATGNPNLEFKFGLRKKVHEFLVEEGFTLVYPEDYDMDPITVVPLSVAEVKKADKAFKKTASSDIQKELDRLDEEARKRLEKARDDDNDEDEDEDEKPKKKPKKKPEKKAKKKPEPVEEEEEDEEEELEDDDEEEEEGEEEEVEMPSENEVKGMKKKQLLQVIDDFDLDVEDPETLTLKELREAVIEEIE